MDGLRRDSAAARFVAEALREPFVLIDVGCSGGIDSAWSVFGDKLVAYAFDPALAEIERLARAEPRPGVRYVPAFVAAPADHPVRAAQPGLPFYRRNPHDRLAWGRTAILREAAGSGLPPPPHEAAFSIPLSFAEPNPVSEPFSLDAAPVAEDDASGPGEPAARMGANEWHRTALADHERPISLPRFLATEGVQSIDFIKIDCDGPDFEILSSLEGTLHAAQALALCLEVNFIGATACNQHTFHNTDRFMRRNDFDLAELSVRRYASSALPFLYTDPHPYSNRNVGGRPYQGDALYARDFGWTDTHALSAQYSDDKLLKLVAVMALFGRVDQAAELLIMFRARLAGRLDVDRTLDLLTREIHELQAPLFDEGQGARTYRQYMDVFETDDPAAYDAERRRERWTADLKARAEALQAQLEAAARERDDLAVRLKDVLGSASWRLTGPLRALRLRWRR